MRVVWVSQEDVYTTIYVLHAYSSGQMYKNPWDLQTRTKPGLRVEVEAPRTQKPWHLSSESRVLVSRRAPASATGRPRGLGEGVQHAVTPSTSSKRQRQHFANKGLSSQSYGFSSSHVLMWKLDHKEGRMLKNWCFWTVVLKKFLNSLDRKEIKPVNPKGNQPWIFTRRTDAEAPRLWSPDTKSWHIRKTLMLGKTEGKKRRGDRGWDDWMASQNQWTWVWTNFRK